MYVSKKQLWILEIIKGPDLQPVGNNPGRYSTRGHIAVFADPIGMLTISPDDVLDLSSADSLFVHQEGGACEIPWEQISRMEFEEPAAETGPVIRPAYEPGKQRILSIPLGKKVS